jgi:hypothetical protein
VIPLRWKKVEVDLLWLSVGVVIGILAGSMTVLLLRLDFWMMKYREFHSTLDQLKREVAALRRSMGLQPEPAELPRKKEESAGEQQRNLDEMRDELNRLREEIRRSLKRSA